MHDIFGISTLAVTIYATYILDCRLVEGDGCLTTQNDTGSLLIKQMQADIDAAECALVESTMYSDYNATDDEEFDFLIVGAGSAGCVVANRLSENPNWRVLLLEAGGDPTITDQIPGYFGSRFDSDIVWKYHTVPDLNSCLGSKNQSCKWPRGKVVGGSSMLNAMFYVRGSPEDFRYWGDLKSPSWKYTDMLYYFKKSEDLVSKDISNNKDFLKYHGVGGYLHVDSYQDDVSLFLREFSRGFGELGYETNSDVNAEYKEGLYRLQGALTHGRRVSTAWAFLHSVKNRSNLKLMKNSLVTKILFDENRVAKGLEYIKNNKSNKVYASKEVIICAGVVNSPQLLMLSGIGPEEHLQELDIDVLHNLKVGYNLQDHVSIRGHLVSFNVTLPASDNIHNIYEFLINGTGPFTGLGSGSLGTFYKTSQASYPNIQIHLITLPANVTDLDKIFNAVVLQGLNENILNSIAEVLSNKMVFFPAPLLLRPKSRGRILLQSNDPHEHPLIYSGYLTDYEDVEEILEAVDFINQFIRTQAMVGLGAKVEPLDVPDCGLYEFQSMDYWVCMIRQTSVTFFHPAGTCKMGLEDDEASVVDTNLRVIGVDRLRVCDASVMPNLTSGNIQAPVIAIAEKASDMIKSYWGYS